MMLLPLFALGVVFALASLSRDLQTIWGCREGWFDALGSRCNRRLDARRLESCVRHQTESATSGYLPKNILILNLLWFNQVLFDMVHYCHRRSRLVLNRRRSLVRDYNGYF